MNKVQITKNTEWGEVEVSLQEVLIFHGRFPGKLSRGNNVIGYVVASEFVPELEASVQEFGFRLKVLQ
jgi:hypothetical protein